MPHVVFDKKINLDELAKQFKMTMIKDPFLIKLQNVYVDKEKRSALISTVVIDNEHRQFFIEIVTRENKTTVRLFPFTDPEKTNGVKTSLGLLASVIQSVDPECVITKTNIKEFLIEEKLV